jgi:hypothetical protein
MASMFAFKELPESPTLDTGASFSVTVQTTDSGDGAGFAANRVRTLGFPSFTRVTPGRRQLHQAMVGPYASLDEAETMQRRLTRSGFPEARIFVDESLRNAPRNQVASAGVTEGNPNVLLIGAPDRLSVVFELPREPRQVRSRRVENVLDLDAGPMSTKIAAQEWSAPEGVHLVERVSIEGVQASETGDFLRAHITVPEFARANVRAEGRRIYVDVSWPMVAPDVVAPPPPRLPHPQRRRRRSRRRVAMSRWSMLVRTRALTRTRSSCVASPNADRGEAISNVGREVGIAGRASCARRDAVGARDDTARLTRASRVGRSASDVPVVDSCGPEGHRRVILRGSQRASARGVRAL